MEKASDDIIVAIIIASIVTVILAVFTMLFFLVFVRKKRIINKKKDELTQSYEKLLLQTKLEIQQETLNHISREIHDNIGQVLSFVKLSLGTASGLDADEKQKKIEESVHLVAEVINDLRDLSRSISFERIKKDGLYQIIKEETEKLNRSGMIETSFHLTGNPVELELQTNLVLYRIFQEIINNTLKHSGSAVLVINLCYAVNLLNLTIADKGKGFDTTDLNKFNGSGLRNIRQRASLINADISIDSAEGLGCTTVLTLKLSKDNIPSP